jgi:hypothetical protein
MRHGQFVALLGGASLASPLAARAQQTAVKRVSVLITYPKDEQEDEGWLTTFQQALEKLGWIDGQNIKFTTPEPGTMRQEGCGAPV